jgi:hypothetical protein
LNGRTHALDQSILEVTGKRLIKVAVVTAFLWFAFLLPLIWWPPRQSDLALLLFLLTMCAGAGIVYYISVVPASGSLIFLRAGGVVSGLFLTFVIYVFVYRATCL